MSKLAKAVWLALVLALAFLIGLPTAQAEDETGAKASEAKDENRAPLWVIEGDVPTYLFGTMHVPDPRIMKLPEIVDQAIEASDVLVGEMPMDMASQMKAQRAALLPAGDNLEKALGAELYERVVAAFPPAMPKMLYRQFSPFAVMSLIEMGRYMQPMLQGRLPLDMTLHKRFQKAKKKTDALETVEDQLNVINAFTREEQVEMLRATVAKHEREKRDGSDSLEQTLKWYLAGDYDALLKFVEADLTAQEALNEKAKSVMLFDRNVKMVDTLIAKMKAEPDVVRFVALGAGHYPGKKGVIALLKAKGYKVRKLEKGDKLPAKKEPAEATK
ncbi:MAG: TraB/GumN family protein [Planctomycetota bacterium]|nr:TraB/GumN family protein [Planctomycetota bacterium]